MSSDQRHRDPRRRHAPVGQVGRRLHRLRHGRRPAPRWPTPGLQWNDVQYVAGADTIRNGYPGFVAGSTFAQKLGWTGVRISSSYAACASGAQALNAARAQILAGFCDVALVIGADTTPKGFFAPVGGDRRTDPDWLRFHLLGATNPVYFALSARRRMDLYGATLEDFAQVKVKNARHGLENPNARFRKENTVDDVLNSPVVSDPLRLLDICATSDGAAAMIVASADYAERHLGSLDGVPKVKAVVDRHADVPADHPRAARLRHRLDRGRAGARAHLHRPRSPGPPTRRRASGPRTSTWRRSTTCRPRSSSTGTRASGCARRARPSSSCAPVHDHDRRADPGQPQRRSGVLRRGHPGPGDRPGVRADLAAAGPGGRPPGRGRTVGITANQGLFGHGSSVIVAK